MLNETAVTQCKALAAEALWQQDTAPAGRPVAGKAMMNTSIRNFVTATMKGENMMFSRMKLVTLFAVLSAAILIDASPTVARGLGWGPRLGFTLNPDQVHVGAHLDAGFISREIRMQPNFELGFGGDRTTASFNIEGIHDFAAYRSGWAPYIGTGLGIVMTSVDGGRGNLNRSDLGIQFLGGLERPISNGNTFFTEIKLGMADSPAFKWTAGWTFYH